MNPNLYVIGLTGNVATGKSAVAGMLAWLGAKVIDADEVAHRMMERGTSAWQEITDEFGLEILDHEGRISRPRLAARVFADSAALVRLEAIVHPAVLADIDAWLQDIACHAQSSPRVAVVEAIKLLESRLASRCDEIWVVIAPREQQLERLERTRGLTPEQSALRIDAQSPQSAKAAFADVVICNDGTLQSLEARVAEQWERVMASLQGG